MFELHGALCDELWGSSRLALLLKQGGHISKAKTESAVRWQFDCRVFPECIILSLSLRSLLSVHLISSPAPQTPPQISCDDDDAYVLFL